MDKAKNILNDADFENEIPPISELPDISIDEEFQLSDSFQHHRTIARQLALQVLYELDVTGHPIGVTISSLLGQYPSVPRETRDYVVRLVQGVMQHRESLDKMLVLFVTEWPLAQIPVVDRCVFRLATYEYAFMGEVPLSVMIDEGVALVRVFGSVSSLGFANAVLRRLLEDETLLLQTLGLSQLGQLPAQEGLSTTPLDIDSDA